MAEHLDLLELACRLRDIPKEIAEVSAKEDAEVDWPTVEGLLSEFFSAKDQILSIMAGMGIVELPKDIDSELHEILNAVRNRKLLRLESVLGEFNKDFSAIREPFIDSALEDYIFFNYSGSGSPEFAERFVRFGIMFIDTQQFPEPLAEMFYEAKAVYAHGERYAVIALCRMMLEAAVKHVCQSKRIALYTKENGRQEFLSVSGLCKELAKQSNTYAMVHRDVEKLNRSLNKIMHQPNSLNDTTVLRRARESIKYIERILKS